MALPIVSFSPASGVRLAASRAALTVAALTAVIAFGGAVCTENLIRIDWEKESSNDVGP